MTYFRGRYFEPRFTDSEMIEIGRARERLEAYRNKVQPYPPELETEEPKPQVQEVIHRHSDMGKQEFDLLQQTALKLEYLNTKLTDHLEFKKKPQPIKSKSKGIKVE